MNFKRADRVAELIRAEMADIIIKEVKDPRLHSVTITSVKISDDLRNAKIYFVEMGKDECSPEIKAGLTKAAGFIRRELGKRMQLRLRTGTYFLFMTNLLDTVTASKNYWPR